MTDQLRNDSMLTVRCPKCGGENVPLPPIQAPAGHAFNAALVLVTCRDCGAMNSLDDCTEVRNG